MPLPSLKDKGMVTEAQAVISIYLLLMIIVINLMSPFLTTPFLENIFRFHDWFTITPGFRLE
jgi:hypothetical protein